MKIQSLKSLEERLIEKGFLLETRPATTRRVGRRTVIEVGNTDPLDGQAIFAESSIAHFLECMRQDRLSWLLFDGSIVQISYSIQGNVITSHRYHYFPAPFEADLRSALGSDLL